MTAVYDLVIVGGGPSGLTAGLYAGRAMLKTLIIERAITGGLMAVTDKLENYPGHESITGGDLSAIMEKQARKFGAEIVTGDTSKIEKNGAVFTVFYDNKNVEARAVIYAAGSVPRKATVPGEKEFTGKGVSYCAVCDGAFYRNLRVAVIGGGDSSLKEALFLTKFASEVVIIHRRGELRAEKIIQEEVKKNSKIKFMLDTVITEISGTDFVEKIKVKNVKTEVISEHSFDGVFVFIGYEPQVSPVSGLAELSARGRIIVDKSGETKTPGLFAAGDVTEKLVNQVATAVGDGATCAVAAEHYLAKS